MQVRVLWWLWRENLRRAVVLQLVTACSDISPHISRSAAPLYLSGLDEYRDAADQLVGDEISEQAIISCQTIAHPKFSLFTFENEGSFNIFRLFWSVDFSRCRATIMPFKVCEIVSAQKLIRAGDDADSWSIRSNRQIFIFSGYFEIVELVLIDSTVVVTKSSLSDSFSAKFKADDRMTATLAYIIATAISSPYSCLWKKNQRTENVLHDVLYSIFLHEAYCNEMEVGSNSSCKVNDLSLKLSVRLKLLVRLKLGWFVEKLNLFNVMMPDHHRSCLDSTRILLIVPRACMNSWVACEWCM